MSTVYALVIGVAAVLGAIAALGSWRISHRTAKSAERTEKASVDIATIEQRRFHAELTPRFLLTWHDPQGGDGRLARVAITLVGPPGLDRLDRIELIVRDDGQDHTHGGAGPPNGPTVQDLADTVWGPWCFTPQVNNAPSNGRTVGAFELVRGGSWPVQMSRTQTPWWIAVSGNSKAWDERYGGDPIRMSIVCSRSGYDQWVVPVEWPEVVRRDGQVLKTYE